MTINNIITLYSFSDYWSNFTSYIHKNLKCKDITVTDKYNNEIILPFNAETIDYPIKIKINEKSKSYNVD